MNEKTHKLKIAIISLTSCEGCQFAILDQGKEFLNLLKYADLKEFRLIEEVEYNQQEKWDIVFVEGNPVTEENFKLLQEARQKSKILVALGNCAALGGVPEIVNYQDRQKLAEYVYGQKRNLPEFKVKQISEAVKVDYVIPGCPIEGLDFYKCFYAIMRGSSKIILPKTRNPLCYECQAQGIACVLRKGEICLGPITQGGCQAICLSGGLRCEGCRGLVAGGQVKNHIDYLKKQHSAEEVNSVLEIYGNRDEAEGLIN